MVDVKKVGVVGCGLMGSGIVHSCAQNGYEVICSEMKQEFIDRGIGRIEHHLGRAVEKGKIDAAEKDATLGRITGTTNLEDLADCDVVIEAVIENVDIKKEVFGTLDKACGPDTIFCSNTSSISITEIASATERPEKMCGLHFFNPVPVMPLVEIVRGLVTSDDTIQFARDFAASLKKDTIVAKDTPGFIVNLLLVPYLLGAVKAFDHGIGTAEDIDKGMKLGCNHPMGPLTLLDFVGIDTTLYIADVMFREFKDPLYAAPPLLRNMVRAGHMGRKSGRGFYTYEKKA